MTPRIVKLIAEIDEFKGYWKGIESLSPQILSSMRILATIESTGSSTRIEGAKLSNREVAALLKGLDLRSFQSRDEQAVAGYAIIVSFRLSLPDLAPPLSFISKPSTAGNRCRK